MPNINTDEQLVICRQPNSITKRTCHAQDHKVPSGFLVLGNHIFLDIDVFDQVLVIEERAEILILDRRHFVRLFEFPAKAVAAASTDGSDPRQHAEHCF